jgi:RHS repeat-associated protein
VANLLTGLGVDEYFTRTDAAGTRGFLTDALGSTVALTDPAGTVQTSYTYEPFGAVTIGGSASSNALQYTGREHDGTGLYYYRARYYHPTLSRFVSEDPIGLPGGPNLYAYAGNNPIRFRDPSGLCRIEARFAHVAFGAYHAYLLTTDPSGARRYYRGGPMNEFPGGSTGGASGSPDGRIGGRKDTTALTDPPWGPIRTRYGAYLPQTPDWDPGFPPSMVFLDDNESCAPNDRRFAEIMDEISSANIPYDLRSTNSNAVVTHALRQSGFTPGAPPVRAPGWNTPLLLR